MNKKYKNNIDVFKQLTTPTQNEGKILSQADAKTVYLPKEITAEDVEYVLFEQFNNGDFTLYISDENNERKKVPVFYLTNERWGEFLKTWKFVNEDKNVAPPFITILRVNDPSQGEYSGVKFSIPNRRGFQYLKVPFYENDRYGYDVYSIPQPIAIDMNFEVRFFSRYQVDVNLFQKLILKNFNSLQYYINVNGQYFRCIMDGNIGDESIIENVNDIKINQQTVKIKVHAYLIDPEEFKVIKSYNRKIVNTKVDGKSVRKDIF